MNVICIDVGSPKNIGWANDRDQTGSALTLTDELHRAGRLLLAGERVALGRPRYGRHDGLNSSASRQVGAALRSHLTALGPQERVVVHLEPHSR